MDYDDTLWFVYYSLFGKFKFIYVYFSENVQYDLICCVRKRHRFGRCITFDTLEANV